MGDRMVIKATFNNEGFPTGFYDTEIHGEKIPDAAVEISANQWEDFIKSPGRRRWDGENVVEYTPPAPIPTADDYRREIQSLIDTTAQERQYDSGATLASYVNSTVPEWAAEAQTFVAWRDQVWAYARAEIGKVQSGEREHPSVEDFLDELPGFEWPSVGENP